MRPPRYVQLAFKAGDPPEPPREIEPEGDATTLEYSLIWFPYYEIAGYIFDCPDKFRPGNGKRYRLFEENIIAEIDSLTADDHRFVSMKNTFGFVWNSPAIPLIIKKASDDKFYCVRHNRLYCAYRTFDRLGVLCDVPSVKMLDQVGFANPQPYVPVRIAHPTDKWGDYTRAALVHPVEQVDRGPEGLAWMGEYPEAVWPCPDDEIWRK